MPTQAIDTEELTAESTAAAATGIVDAIEWRIDPLFAAFPGSALTRAEAALRLLPHALRPGLPILLTVRTGFEGGQVEITEDDYAEAVRALIAGVADIEVAEATGSDAVDGTEADVETGASGATVAVDVEIDRSESRSLIASAREAGVPVVASHHNFEATDSVGRLLATFAAMSEAGADVAKVAMMPQAPSDVLRLLEATAAADASSEIPVIGISMGPSGRTSRIMGADFGSCATFAQIGQGSAPGQIDAVVLAEILDRVTG